MIHATKATAASERRTTQAAAAWPVVLLAAVLTVSTSLPWVRTLPRELRAPLGAGGAIRLGLALLMAVEWRRARRRRRGGRP